MTGGQSTQTQTSAENNIAHTIPREIFLEILKFACAAFASAQLHPTDRRVPHLDVPTALRLCLISRDSYATLAPLIYRHVHLTRPSKIEAFNETLKGQPALRKHVRTAWFGADAPCSPNPDFPLQDDGMTASILTSEELPRDISIGTIWHRDFTDRRYSMVLDALDEASCHVGIDATGASLKQHHWRTADEMSVLPYDEYLCRIYEVQAALDLYLRCLREYEDAQIAKEPTYRLDAGRPGFPRFVMLVPGKAVTQGGEIDYLCSMKMIYHHLATSKVFDQVEHPLLLARFKALKSYSKGYYSSNRPTGGSLAYPSRNKFLSREESRIARDAYKDGRPSPYPFMLLKHPMTFHTLACLTQDVVYKLPKLESLALSASLERSFIRRPAETSGLPAMFEKAFGRPSLPSISHLSVGPPSSIKFTPYLLPFLETSSMSTLRSIDIIGECTASVSWLHHRRGLLSKEGSIVPFKTYCYGAKRLKPLLAKMGCYLSCNFCVGQCGLHTETSFPPRLSE